MPYYCVDRSARASTGDHEVHQVGARTWCLPGLANRQDLGFHPSCAPAVQAATQHFDQVNGCAWCLPACHAG